MSVMVFVAMAMLGGCAPKVPNCPCVFHPQKHKAFPEAKEAMLASTKYTRFKKRVAGAPDPKTSCDNLQRHLIRQVWCNEAGKSWSGGTECCKSSDCTRGCRDIRERYVDACDQQLTSLMKEENPVCQAKAAEPATKEPAKTEEAGEESKEAPTTPQPDKSTPKDSETSPKVDG